MKTMKTILSMAALALVGAMTVGCSSDDNSIIDTPQQPEVIKGNVVTMTTTVSLDGGATTTRALTDVGVKTFAAGEKIALVYMNTSSETVKVESTALTAGDITNDGKSATFTFELTDPDKSQDVTYIYPAAMANADGTVNYDALSSQDGTLATLAANLDCCTKSGAWDSDNLPTLALENQLAILALTIKNSDATSDLTSSITSLKITDGTNTYNVTRSAAAGPIYVAIQPTTSAAIGVSASDGTNNYCKSLSGKTYAADNGYSVSWKMDKGACLAFLSGDYEAKNGETLTGALAADATTNIKIADGATVTLKDVTINGTNVDDDAHKHAGITCVGDATIILEGTNSVKGFYEDYPGIYVPDSKTLTIQGTGSLTANGGGYGAGIGGGNDIDCGNIEIKGGEITADGGSDWSGSAGIGGGSFASCGYITISGGTVTANGGDYGAGIGGGQDGICGTITINGGTVTASGNYFGAGIGCGYASNGDETRCGNILIYGGTVTATGGENAAGIGGGFGDGFDTICGTITINNTVTKLTATKGSGARNSIGPAGVDEYVEYCDVVTIGGTVYWNYSTYVGDGDIYLTQDQIIYPAEP